MTQMLAQCQDLKTQVDNLLQLHHETSLRRQGSSTGLSPADTAAIQASLKKASAPKFEIVFAGAFSAGKSISMLINALLGREFKGHATGTECHIEYADNKEETELIQTTRGNLGIRDQVFYVFNRIDETWYNTQLRQKLDDLISSQFHNTQRVYKTNGLLGFYGSQTKQTSRLDRFGLDSVFAESVKGLDGREKTPQFCQRI